MTPRPAEREIRELLRQARVHVVEMRHAQQRRQHDADEPAFFVRVNRVVAAAERAADDASASSSASSGIFASDGPILTPRTNGGRRHAEDAQPRHRHVWPNGYVTRST